MPGTININAALGRVFIGSRRIGETPIGGLSLAIGPHEVVFRHPQFSAKKRVYP